MTVDGLLLAPLVIPAGVLALVVLHRRGASDLRVLATGLFILYVWGAASVTVLPVEVGPHLREHGGVFWTDINLSLFQGLGSGAAGRQQVYLNVLLGVPFGLLVPMMRRLSAFSVLLLGLAFTLTIESLQLVENWFYNGQFRTVDVNDVLFNWLGVVIGYALFRVVAGVLGRWFGDPAQEPLDPQPSARSR